MAKRRVMRIYYFEATYQGGYNIEIIRVREKSGLVIIKFNN